MSTKTDTYSIVQIGTMYSNLTQSPLLCGQKKLIIINKIIAEQKINDKKFGPVVVTDWMVWIVLEKLNDESQKNICLLTSLTK